MAWRDAACRPWWLPVLLVVAVYLVAGWSGLLRIGDRDGADSAAFEAYAVLLDRQGRLPTMAENYEYSLPPGWPVVGVAADRAARALGPREWRPLGGLPTPLRRGLWLLLVGGAAVAVALSRPRSGARLVGYAAGALGVAWAAAYALSLATREPWAPKAMLTFACSAGVVAGAALLGRELAPESRSVPALAALGAALVQPLFRTGLWFHPDPPFALLAIVALILVLRAWRGGWPLRLAVAAGAALGTAALVRQSAPLLIVIVGLSVVLLGRWAALRFLLVAAAVALALAAPWWGYQASRYGNPIQSNLDRPGYMLQRQPVTFYTSSFPVRDLLLDPHREAFRNELLPKFHAVLWSDWFGDNHDWATASRADRVLSSISGGLGFGGDALVLGGLAAFGIPALRRTLVGRARDADAVLAVCALAFLLGWAAFVAQLVRFPQADGDPINPRYLLMLVPVAAVFATVAGRALWARGGLARVLVGTWTIVLVACSAAVLWTSF